VHPFWLSHEEKQTWLKHSIGGEGAGHAELAVKGREERSRGRALPCCMERRKRRHGGRLHEGNYNLFLIFCMCCLGGRRERKQKEDWSKFYFCKRIID
jgi:hypothetical protein